MRELDNGQPYEYLRWSAVVGAIIVLGITLSALKVSRLDMLFMENGPLENMGMALWILSAAISAVAYRRASGRLDRLATFWLAAVSCLAFLREADAHILLNPAVLGPYGIHYRIDWLLDRHVSLLLKLAAVGLIALIVLPLLVPMRRLTKPFLRLAWAGDAAIGMLMLAVAGQIIGFTMDDLLRGSPLIAKDVRQLTEETGELLGTIAFCAGTLLILKHPISERLEMRRTLT